MSLKLHTSVADTYGFISRYDSAMTLGPEPELTDPPERKPGESDADYKARADAWAAPYVEWERPLKLARETGNYTPITAPDVKPLWFKLRQVPASLWAKYDRHAEGLSNAQRAQLIFRIAVVGLDGDVPMEAYDKKVAPAVDRTMSDLGPIRPEAFVDLFTGHEHTIIEIAAHVRDRRHAPPN